VKKGEFIITLIKMIIRAYPLGEEISISNRNLQTISVADKIKS